MKFDPARHRLCVITGGRHLEVARHALRGGAKFIQFREKERTAREMLATALKLRELTREVGALLIVNDRVDIAAAVEADGVHLGADDLPVAVAREILGPGAVIGASARTPERARAAAAAGADYLGVGPVFEARASKPDAPEPHGPELIRRICSSCNLPVLAIGGIDAGNAAEPIGAGASGIAVLSAVVGAEDITGATVALLELVNRLFDEGGER